MHKKCLIFVLAFSVNTYIVMCQNKIGQHLSDLKGKENNMEKYSQTYAASLLAAIWPEASNDPKEKVCINRNVCYRQKND